MITVALLLLAHAQDPALSAALDKLGASDGITFTFVDRTVGGTASKWTLKAQKPNLLTADSELYTLVADGSTIVVFTKSANSYTSEEQTEASLAKLLQRPEMLPARLFLDPKGKWLDKASSAGSRKRRGVDLTGTLLHFTPRQSATVYFGTADKAINYFMIETKDGRTIETRILDDFKIERAEHPATTFVFSPSADATNASEEHAGLSEGLQEDIANGDIPYRQLTWSDFRVVASRTLGLKAYTKAYIRTNYVGEYSRSGDGWTVKLTAIEIRSGLIAKETWRSPSLTQATLDRLLPHEQGHLDISEVQARKLRRMKLSDWPTGRGTTRSAAAADASQKIRQIVEDALVAAAAQQALYDKETRLGLDAAAQRRWELKIASQLNARS